MINAALSDLGIKDPLPSDGAAAGQKVTSTNQLGSIGSKSERLEDDDGENAGSLTGDRLEDDLIDFVSDN